MNSFEHVDATSVAGAIRLLGADGRARPIAGGTDLLNQMRLGIVSPARLVNLKTIAGLADIRFNAADGLRLGSIACLEDIAEKDFIRERYRVLFQALRVAASPQLRNFGTIGGNLAQASRCWYYRGEFRCWLKGGDVCHAREGENSRHAIFGEGPCCTVSPSDPAPALIALGAEVNVVGPCGGRRMPLEKLFQQPGNGSRQLTVLMAPEVVGEIRVPTPAPESRGVYLKAMDRKAWSFALASVAGQISLEGNSVRDIRLVLGGVAPVPWRLTEVETALRGRRLDPAVIADAARLAVSGAKPLSGNGYKVELVVGLVTEALTRLSNNG